jgi:putative ABC transport system permease protein
LDGGIVTVVGVMPPGFDSDVDFWVPLSSGVSGFRRDDRQFMVFARLAPSVSVDAATAELADLSTRLAAEHPSTNKDWVTFPTRITRLHGRDSRRAFVLLQAAVGILLLIACANIANILLARGTRRRHEIAVRVSLGASRARMLGTLLTESLLLAIAGGAIGILLAMWGIRLARATMSFPSSIDPALNGVVLAFTAALSMLTGILCGIVPAARGSRIEPSLVLREERPGDSGASRGRLRAALVGAQVACALVLVTCGALMLRTLENRHRIDLGFDPRAAIRADLALAGDRYQTPAVVRRTVDQLIDGLSNGPDVVAAGAITWALPTSAGAQRSLTRPDQRDAALAPSIRRGVEAVTPTYFDAIGAPLRRGRRFAALDREGSAPVAIVNEELVRHLWPDRDPLGQPLRLGSPTEAAPIVTVVGVVATIRRSAMHDTPVARVYLPFAQHPNSTLSLVVRGRGDLATIGRELQAAVQAIDPMLLVEQVRTVEADVAQFIAPIRLITTLLALFGITGLLLAALGIFGTMSYTVSQRSRELAIRAALGADTRTILRLVFASVVRLTTVGVIAGVGLASIATRALTAFLYGVSALDPLTFAMVIAFLTFVAISAAYGPARMAVKADPMTILRR